MDQDDSGYRPPMDPAAQDPSNSAWSSMPFEGSPNTAFAITSPSGVTFLPAPGATPTTPRINGDASTAAGESLPPTSSPSAAEFCSFYERHELVTNLLLVCYIPMDITHKDFSDTMDRIQRHLKVQTINNYYHAPEFRAKFGSTDNSWWESGFSYEPEKHASFVLRLGGNLPFAFHGKHNEVTRPMVFTITASPVLESKVARSLVVQPVPSDFEAALLRPPVAIWRGIGMDADAGQPAAVLALVALYVQAATRSLHSQALQNEWTFHSFLSPHVVDVKSPARTSTRGSGGPRGKDRGRDKGKKAGSAKQEEVTPLTPEGPTQVHYTELFIFTVCSAPIGALANCFACLMPPTAPYNQPSYTLSLCGWWLELTHDSQLFMSNEGKTGPSLELLISRPATRVMGLKGGCSLNAVLTALNKEGQNCDHIQFGFLQRTAGGDSCTLITDGRHPRATQALRSWSSNTLLPTVGDLEDMKRLREKYVIFRRSLGLPTNPSPGPVPSDATSSALVRPGLSYGDVARLPPGNSIELTGFVQHAVLQQVAAASRAINNRFAALEDRQTTVENRQSSVESTQRSHTESIRTLTADQTATQETLQNTRAEVVATQAVVENHTKKWGDLTSFLERQNKILADQDARFQQLDSTLQCLSKRRAPEAGLDFIKPRSPPDHDSYGK